MGVLRLDWEFYRKSWLSPFEYLGFCTLLLFVYIIDVWAPSLANDPCVNCGGIGWVRPKLVSAFFCCCFKKSPVVGDCTIDIGPAEYYAITAWY